VARCDERPEGGGRVRIRGRLRLEADGPIGERRGSKSCTHASFTDSLPRRALLRVCQDSDAVWRHRPHVSGPLSARGTSDRCRGGVDRGDGLSRVTAHGSSRASEGRRAEGYRLWLRTCVRRARVRNGTLRLQPVRVLLAARAPSAGRQSPVAAQRSAPGTQSMCSRRLHPCLPKCESSTPILQRSLPHGGLPEPQVDGQEPRCRRPVLAAGVCVGPWRGSISPVIRSRRPSARPGRGLLPTAPRSTTTTAYTSGMRRLRPGLAQCARTTRPIHHGVTEPPATARCAHPPPRRLARTAGVKTSDLARTDLTRTEVAEARRPAWTGAGADGPEHYYFDGAVFWHQPRHGGSRCVPERQAPPGPWCHKPGCGCPLCFEPGQQPDGVYS
jgi:hypothetical protein